MQDKKMVRDLLRVSNMIDEAHKQGRTTQGEANTALKEIVNSFRELKGKQKRLTRSD